MNLVKNSVINVTLAGCLAAEHVHESKPHVEAEARPTASEVFSVNDEALISRDSIAVTIDPVIVHTSVVEPAIALGQTPPPAQIACSVGAPGILLTPPDQPLERRNGVIITPGTSAE
jgi:hypothetical protein